MVILILNWKDIRNPTSGGAEILTHEMAKRFIKEGHTVMMYVSEFPHCKTEENIDGVRVIRSGKPDLRALQHSVHFRAYRYYKKNLENSVDVIIDELHGMPFFTPLYAKVKVVPLICEVANDIWFKMFSFPWNIIGKVSERFSLLLYKNNHILTISESTKKDLIACSLPKKNITVLPMGINTVAPLINKKEKYPTLVFVARLNKMKGIEDAIAAVSILSRKLSKIHLWVVGKGDDAYVNYLKELVESYNVTKNVTFFDFVTQEKKFQLMAKAHVIVVPSVREGFGLIVPEAGSVGTPAVVYDVPGLRDIVKNGINGIRVSPSATSLAKGIETILNEKKKYRAMCAAAKEESKRYNWDSTAEVALGVIKE
jgi:glycosyltransferase involved in cell wall biosynthesis